MHTPLRAIDLKLKMRKALYRRFSSAQLRAMLTEQTDITLRLFELAWEVTPKIFPQVEQVTASQLIDLATDLPELLMREEPEVLQTVRFDYEILPLTPLRLLHANVIGQAMHYGKQERDQLPQLLELCEDARMIYSTMQKEYVVSGYSSQGNLGLRQVQQVLGLPQNWNKEEPIRRILAKLIDVGLVERRQSQAEAYQLTLLERHALIEEFHLENHWPAPDPHFDEVAQVRQAVAALSSNSDSSAKL